MTQVSSRSTVSGPITGGKRGWPFAASTLDISKYGYTEAEYYLEGTATSYKLAPGAELTRDGHWNAVPSGESPFRNATGSLTARGAPLMESIVPIILLLFLTPGIVYGYLAGTFKSHRDVVQAMARTLNTMGYYLVMAFCAAMFIYAFNTSNLGRLLAVSGANALSSLGLPGGVTICGLILVCGGVNLVMGSASAKWALLSPIFVPMLMQLGISPELTQAAYRIGDSTTNIVTPLMPYFPLIVTFAQKYHRGTGIGTLISVMLPYSMAFLIAWTLFLLLFWAAGFPLGLGATYAYPTPT